VGATKVRGTKFYATARKWITKQAGTNPGGSSGIGLAVAEQAALEGAEILGIGFDVHCSPLMRAGIGLAQRLTEK
jgi:hypothetical protein